MRRAVALRGEQDEVLKGPARLAKGLQPLGFVAVAGRISSLR